MTAFEGYFSDLTANEYAKPHAWQNRLAEQGICSSALIRIPTGFGKTLGVVAVWLWHRIEMQNEQWPRRLVWCLPTRVLVEQTEAEVRAALRQLGLLWDGAGEHKGKIGVHLLMGGTDSGEWHLHPEHFAVLIGTQDMLLSRAMNRGYASPRARWPMEYGLLNQDALWIMDEVQLMDVGLATSAQLQAFRDEDGARGRSQRPCVTWWMSATLQREWFAKSPDTQDLLRLLDSNEFHIASSQRTGYLWDEVRKPLELACFKHPKALAKEISERHAQAGNGALGPTLVVVNTVDRATAIWDALRKDKTLKHTDLRLVHSRFRPAERAAWRSEFLNRAACAPGTDRIIVATQVIEAGADISSALLFTELAPWASLVQRFGRCARWGGSAQVIVVDFELKTPAPYALDEIDAARSACGELSDVAPLYLEQFEDTHSELLQRLYPYHPEHLLLRHEADELFDTTSDLTGADIDISRFIRSGDERDIQVFWEDVEATQPSADVKPTHDAICSVPFLMARDWLCGKESSTSKYPRLKQGVRAWVWVWAEKIWRLAERRDIFPGQTLLIESIVGGYDPLRGWSPESKSKVEPSAQVEKAGMQPRPCWRPTKDGWELSERLSRSLPPDVLADDGEDDESLSIFTGWQTIATHGYQTGCEVKGISEVLTTRHAELLNLAGRWHDAGKAHPAFQGSIQAIHRPEREDIAKAPEQAWPCSAAAMYRIDANDRRPGFRHELASTLALFGVLQRHAREHAALLGPWHELLKIGAKNVGSPLESTPGQEASVTTPPTPLEQEIINLTAEDFDLLAYLVCSHHGKVRMAWHASPADQKANDPRLRIRGLRDSDILPPITLTDEAGDIHTLPASTLDLSPAAAGLSPRTGASWTERVLGLLDHHGPFTLAWLEALLRAADQRASRKPLADHLLENQNKDYGLETNHRTMAQAAAGRAEAHPPEQTPAQSGPKHGLRRRAGGREDAGSRTQTPHHATRYLSTTLGILTYAQLAPHLSRQVQGLEADIANGLYCSHSIDESLVLAFHQRICSDFLPKMAGRWRSVNVRVSDHEAPAFQRIPELMRNYCLDLQARLEAFKDPYDDLTLEFLAFAEGRLLWIHPFEDFNGRTTRVLLAELLRRLQLPALDPTPDPGEETTSYLAALKASDRSDWQPLKTVWLKRFDKEGKA